MTKESSLHFIDNLPEPEEEPLQELVEIYQMKGGVLQLDLI